MLLAGSASWWLGWAGWLARLAGWAGWLAWAGRAGLAGWLGWVAGKGWLGCLAGWGGWLLAGWLGAGWALAGWGGLRGPGLMTSRGEAKSLVSDAGVEHNFRKADITHNLLYMCMGMH